MKIIHKDLKKGIIKVGIQNMNDLWFLSHIIDKDDLISGKTQRKIKIATEGERNSKIITKMVFLKIQTEKIEFHKYSDKLRVSGKVTDGPEDVARGSYHTLTLEPDVAITIEKNKWLKYQLDKLNDSAKQEQANILICILDREKAIFANLRNYGFDIISEITGNVQKKDNPEIVKSVFYQKIIDIIRDYNQKHNYSKIIVASPAFWKEYLIKLLDKGDLKSKIITATCNSIDVDGINEVLKRPEILTALKDDRIVKEMNDVEELLTEIKKDAKATYGLSETENAINIGAVKKLLITDSFIHQAREKGNYNRIDYMLKTLDSMKGEINIISSDHDGGKKLEGLGGIAAILRYKV